MRPFHCLLRDIASAAFIGLSTIAAGAADTSTLQASQLYSATTGKASRFACFVRQYDDAHLASHPHQNVRIMRLLARPSESDDGSSSLQIGVYFRGVKKRFDIFGSCYPDKEHPGTLACGIDCDGGQFGLRQTTADTVLADIPEGIRASIDDPDGAKSSYDAHGKARFGSDDRTFRLERAELRECTSMDVSGDLKK